MVQQEHSSKERLKKTLRDALEIVSKLSTLILKFWWIVELVLPIPTLVNRIIRTILEVFAGLRGLTPSPA